MDTLLEYVNRFELISLLDILLVTAVLYGALLLIRGTRAVQVLRGFMVLALGVVLFSSVIELPAFRWLINQILPVLLLSVPIIFQPELRRALERLGRTGNFSRLFRRNVENPAILATQEACIILSQRRHGALIVFERDTGLQEHIDTGIELNAAPSPELLLTIFNKTTELHDGAVIVRNKQLAAAACVMPLWSGGVKDRQMGLRHRAALGISDVSDAVAVVVSEETGQVSIAHNGRIIRRQDPARLTALLNGYFDSSARGQGKGT